MRKLITDAVTLSGRRLSDLAERVLAPAFEGDLRNHRPRARRLMKGKKAKRREIDGIGMTVDKKGVSLSGSKATARRAAYLGCAARGSCG